MAIADGARFIVDEVRADSARPADGNRGPVRGQARSARPCEAGRRRRARGGGGAARAARIVSVTGRQTVAGER